MKVKATTSFCVWGVFPASKNILKDVPGGWKNLSKHLALPAKHLSCGRHDAAYRSFAHLGTG
jgi:hypothetical protein